MQIHKEGGGATALTSETAALMEIVVKLGCSPVSLRVWMRQVQRDGGERSGQTSAENLRNVTPRQPIITHAGQKTSTSCTSAPVLPLQGPMKKINQEFVNGVGGFQTLPNARGDAG